MERPDWAPEGIDVSRPSAARLYDYFLGGSHNFAADRAMAEKIVAAAPEIPLMAQANRAFLRRAVRTLAESGVEQFIDIGSGIPTLGNVHEVARAVAPAARVVYVDIDPVAVAHSTMILGGTPGIGVLRGDVRAPDEILEHEVIKDLIDFTAPVAILLVALLQFVRDEDDPKWIFARLSDALPAGNYLVLSHGVTDGWQHDLQTVRDLYRRTTTPTAERSRAQVAEFFAGYDLIEPGLVWVPQWRPDSPDGSGPQPQRSGSVGGVGRKR